LRCRETGQLDFGSVLLDKIHWNRFAASAPAKARLSAIWLRRRASETAVSGDFYIGVGDRFDDDRRRIVTGFQVTSSPH
jgi:hypothetical protein